MKMLGRLLLIVVLVGAALQLARPTIPSQPATAEVQAPPEIRRILEKDCYSCHSDQRRLAWFDEVVPAYWLVRHDILTARQHLNFSTLGAQSAAAQKATLYEAVNMIQLGAMPLPKFVQLHPEAKVTPEELATLKAYLAPWPASLPTPPPDTSSPISLTAVQPEWNGLPFDPAFESWRPISTTDRGDNNTFRFILGNDIAFKAAQSGNISPWPDGARFAKIAWWKEAGPDGLVRPGKFFQVELMVKDAARYKDTEGWGWGRWRGLGLKPYGKDARFVTECTSCHLPVQWRRLRLHHAHHDGLDRSRRGREQRRRLAARRIALPTAWLARHHHVRRPRNPHHGHALWQRRRDAGGAAAQFLVTSLCAGCGPRPRDLVPA